MVLLEIVTLTVACAVLLWTYARIKLHRIKQMTRNIPGPKPLPLIGNVLEFGRTTKEMFDNMIRLSVQYGGIMQFWLGPRFSVQLSDPLLIEPILSSSKILDKAWSYKYAQQWLGTGLLLGTGQKWKTHRKLITPTFHFKILEQFVDVFNSNTNILINKLSLHVDGGEFNIYPYITMCALDNICETAMGVKVNAQEDTESEYVTAVRKMCDLIMYRSFRPWLHLDAIFNMTSLGRLQAKCLHTLHNTTKQVLESRKKELLKGEKSVSTDCNEEMGEKKKVTFLDLLIQTTVDGVRLPDEDIREEVDTFMFEGHDTSASSISFTCWALANYQDVQCKVVSELVEIFGDSDRVPTYQDIQDMKYLEMVVKESLRLYPSVPVYGRQLSEDCTIDAYTLPKGTNVFIMPYVMHRNAKYFPDPEKFDPDRFLAENILRRHPYCYIPFAAGPRNCVGQKFAMLEIKATICQILRRYKLLPGETTLSITDEIVLKSTTGINVKLQPR